MTARPGWPDQPEHDEPVDLGQAIAEWTAAHHRPGAPGIATHATTSKEAGQ